MPKFPAIPDFYDLPSALQSLRAVKDIVEQLAGLRQGGSLGAPAVYLQSTPPIQTRGVVLTPGDFWINPGPPAMLSYWTGSAWASTTA